MQVTLDITEQCIAVGIACDCNRCPVAIAGIRAGFRYVHVLTEIRAFNFRGDRQHYVATASPNILDFMDALDMGRQVSPFTANVEFERIEDETILC